MDFDPVEIDDVSFEEQFQELWREFWSDVSALFSEMPICSTDFDASLNIEERMIEALDALKESLSSYLQAAESLSGNLIGSSDYKDCRILYTQSRYAVLDLIQILAGYRVFTQEQSLFLVSAFDCIASPSLENEEFDLSEIPPLDLVDATGYGSFGAPEDLSSPDTFDFGKPSKVSRSYFSPSFLEQPILGARNRFHECLIGLSLLGIGTAFPIQLSSSEPQVSPSPVAAAPVFCTQTSSENLPQLQTFLDPIPTISVSSTWTSDYEGVSHFVVPMDFENTSESGCLLTDAFNGQGLPTPLKYVPSEKPVVKAPYGKKSKPKPPVRLVDTSSLYKQPGPEL